jgi:hypothetical protein
MRRTFAYIISLILISATGMVHGQDTILFPLKIKVGLELSGPVIYAINNNLSVEGNLSVDINEITSVVLAAGYLDYNYSQYNYSYFNKGIFIRAGTDFNLRKPENNSSKYWAGIGFRYGFSSFTAETPFFKESNYWGTTNSSISSSASTAHFLEATPGLRTEVFRNVSIGWSVSLRMLVYTNAGKDVRPIYFPGFGKGDKTFSTGFSYFITWNIPYKTIRYIVKPEPVNAEETPQPGNKGTNQQSSGIR